MIDKGYSGSLPRHAFAVRLMINKPVEYCQNLQNCSILSCHRLADLSNKQDVLFSKKK
jgi:hypothetical protein